MGDDDIVVSRRWLNDEIARRREERDAWIRKYTRLEGAINAHQKVDRFKDDHDEALYKVRDKLNEGRGQMGGSTGDGWHDPSVDVANVNAAYRVERDMADHYRRALDRIAVHPRRDANGMQAIAVEALKYDPLSSSTSP